MDRRKSLGLLGAGVLFIANSSFSSIKSTNKIPTFQENFKGAFEKRWEGVRQHAFEVFDSMPGDQFDFKPTEDVMSFGNLFCHIGWSLDIYKEVLNGKSKFDKLETNDKNTVFGYLQSRFDGFEEAMDSVIGERLYLIDHHFSKTEPWMNFSNYDVLMLSYNHAVHHKGQATTYLRLKGIVPPRYRF
jgi:uncharacterized damage-inducible protein DinB